MRSKLITSLPRNFMTQHLPNCFTVVLLPRCGIIIFTVKNSWWLWLCVTLSITSNALIMAMSELTLISSRVCHGYAAGQLFGHCTRTHEHCTHTAMGVVYVGNRYSISQNLWYRGYPWFFSAIQYYYLLKKINYITC